MSITNKNSNNQNISPLRRWIYLNKYFIKISENKDIKSTATHFLLDGGLWKIPMDKYQEFLLLLSRDLENGIKAAYEWYKTKI